MAPPVFLFNDINVSAITFSDPRVLDNAGKSIYVNYNKKPLFVQTHTGRAPFGLTDWDNEKFSINLTLSNKDVLDKLQELDSHIIDYAYANSQSWFKQKFASRDVLAELYSSPIHWSKDKVTGEINTQYDPTLKINVPYRDKEFQCIGYVKSKDGEVKPLEISKDNIYKGANIQVIMQCTGIWIAGKKFGCTFKVAQLMRIDDDDSGPRRLVGYSFIDEE